MINTLLLIRKALNISNYQLLVCILLIVFCISVIGCEPGIYGTRTIGGSDNDWAFSVRQTSDLGYIVAGGTLSFSDNEEVYLIKIDAMRDTEWSKIFGGSQLDQANSVRQTSDGGYILAGFTESFGVGGRDFYLIKTNSDGDEEWSRTYGGSDDDCAYSVIQTPDDGYFIAGTTYSFGAGRMDIYIIKTDADGIEQWSRALGGPQSDGAKAAQQTSDGGYILAGGTMSAGAGVDDIYLVKTDADGNEQWSMTFGGSDYDLAESVTQTSDGGYLVAGVTRSFGAGHEDVYLVMTDPDGNEMWHKTFGGSEVDAAYSAQQIADGNYIIAGMTGSFGDEDGDVYIIKIDPDGNELYHKTYRTSGCECCYSIHQTSDYGFILAGIRIKEYPSTGSSGADIYLIRTNDCFDFD